MKEAKLVIGFITYGESTAKYLPYFLASLKKQNYNDFKILAIDNSENEDNENRKFIKENYPEIDFRWAGKNLGFAKAFNKMIRAAIEMEAEYFLCLNPDIILDPNAIGELIKKISVDKNIGAVQPKILKWDYESNRKTSIIDSLGLVMEKNFRFYDDRQGEMDDKSEEKKEIFGFTGAAVLLKIEVLKDVVYKDEFFDEMMFMYKEDCDLSLRMRLAGWKIILAPDAIVYHDRTAAIIGRNLKDILRSRLNKSRQVKKWSFLNQWIIILKYINLFSGRIRTATWRYQIKSLLFILFFEPYLLGELWKLGKLRKEIKRKKESLKIKVNINKIEKLII
jgi:GT2 family glycosyltransferase